MVTPIMAALRAAERPDPAARSFASSSPSTPGYALSTEVRTLKKASRPFTIRLRMARRSRRSRQAAAAPPDRSQRIHFHKRCFSATVALSGQIAAFWGRELTRGPWPGYCAPNVPVARPTRPAPPLARLDTCPLTSKFEVLSFDDAEAALRAPEDAARPRTLVVFAGTDLAFGDRTKALLKDAQAQIERAAGGGQIQGQDRLGARNSRARRRRRRAGC